MDGWYGPVYLFCCRATQGDLLFPGVPEFFTLLHILGTIFHPPHPQFPNRFIYKPYSCTNLPLHMHTHTHTQTPTLINNPHLLYATAVQANTLQEKMHYKTFRYPIADTPRTPVSHSTQ